MEDSDSSDESSDDHGQDKSKDTEADMGMVGGPPASRPGG